MKKGVLILLDELKSAGAENVAVNIAIRLKDSDHYTPVVCATRNGGVLEEKLRSNGVRYLLLKRNRFYEVHKFAPLKSLIEEENIQIIHAHMMGSNFWASMLGKFYKTPAIIAHCHAQLYSWGSLFIDRLISKLSDTIIVISDYEKQRLIEEEGISPSKITIIHNGIDLTGYKTEPNLDIKRQLGLKMDSPVVGILAVFRPQKNHELFIQTADEILKKNKDVYFLLVGDGETRKQAEDLASKLGISKNCLFTGFRKDIPDVISIIDVGVLSSHWEGLPLAVLEYMASSKPVVSTSVGGVPEVVQDGLNGFLVPPGDYKTLAQKINLLLDNKDLALEMGKNGFIRVKQEFTMEAMLKNIEDLYTNILETKLILGTKLVDRLN